jgi:choline dehydrogenase
VLTDSPVRRVLVENGRAAGVELERNGSVETIRVRREVLLCGGTIASPQLLLLSGIGDAGALAALGIPVNVDLPAVGRNLQEHVRAQLVYRTKVPSFNRDARGAGLAVQVARYALRKQGLLAVTASQVNGFVRSSPDVDRPDLQIVFRPSSGDYAEGRYIVHDYQGVMAMVGLLRPKSRGHVALRSADPHAAPVIVAGHLTDAADYDPLVRGVELMRRIFATPPLSEQVQDEVRPGKLVTDDASLRGYIRDTADSLYHATGTCAMGAGADCVTTPELQLRGVAGLRVVDASVMPLVPSGNTTAAVLMIAERATPSRGAASVARRSRFRASVWVAAARSPAPGYMETRCSTRPGTRGCVISTRRPCMAAAIANPDSERPLASGRVANTCSRPRSDAAVRTHSTTARRA